MKKWHKLLCLHLLTIAVIHVHAQEYRPRIELAGEWQFALGDTYPTMYNETAMLPGTTDTNRKGIKNTTTSETTHLTRLYSYKGKAWYSRTVNIPQSWKDKLIRLKLERTKPSKVYVDGLPIWSLDNISTPQEYTLDGYLSPGRHTLTIMVDNGSRLPEQLYASSHALTEDTQTNWNGIIGDISLVALANIEAKVTNITPIIKESKVRLQLHICGELSPKDKVQVRAIPQGWNGKISYLDLTGKDFDNTGEEFYEKECDLFIKDLRLWSEFHPDLYTLEVEIEGHDLYSTTFGMREVTADEHHFYVNGNKTFLRGKHDACVFPETGHVPMDVASWRKYLGTCKEWGINHVRFHSWCPPEAAFQAADELGIYLQPELPFWGDFKAEDPILMRYLSQEGKDIINEYGHHPSFVMFALGNELWGSIDKMKEFVDKYREIDPSKLYTFGSNYYLGYQGVKPGMDYFTTCRIGGEAWGSYNTHTRGSFSFADAADGGLINHSYPNNKMTFDEACDPATVPIISHETGQFQHIPDFNQEIPRYKGVLYPYNMEVFRNRLGKAGMLDQLSDFNRASGRWAAQLYKADIEMDLRTKNMAGFQLLDLQDYPGQGSAYVGMLDAFMENKGFITPQQWRAFCSPVVAMLGLQKYCYTEGETIKCDVLVASYGEESLEGKQVDYAINYKQNGEEKAQTGTLTIHSDEKGLINVGQAHLPCPTLSTKDNQQCCPILALLTVKVAGQSQSNSYPIWIYPVNDGNQIRSNKKVIVTHEMTDRIVKKLQKGARVLWTVANDTTIQTIDPLFQTDYWNYRMFKTICENNKKTVSPGTMGILCRPEHPVFQGFPTEEHTNWQWFAILKNSHPVILDHLPQNYRPIVQVIDNIERNHKLGILMEFQVGKGSLLVCSTDLDECDKYVEGRAFRLSLMDYLASPNFRPNISITIEDLIKAFKEDTNETQLEKLNNISPYLFEGQKNKFCPNKPWAIDVSPANLHTMEQLIHYVWKHKLFPLRPLSTTHGEAIEVIDPGLHNRNAGPDFFNAKVKIDNTLWVGNVEIHERASDWYTHGHHKDKSYDNVVLHVCGIIDMEVKNSKGDTLPQMQLDIPDHITQNYQELISIDHYPPCYKIIPTLPRLTIHSWMSALQTERLELKTQTIYQRVKRCDGSWEKALFTTLVRNYGFGINGDAFELWASHIPLQHVAHHRDSLFQIEAIFMGQAGLLEIESIPERYRAMALNEGYFAKLRNEYLYLAHKFTMKPMDFKLWRFLRLRPQNFPHIRISQLATLYHSRKAELGQLLECTTIKEAEQALQTHVSPYWETHYAFGAVTDKNTKRLTTHSLDLQIINTLIPTLFAYGRHKMDDQLCDRAFDFLELLSAENNHIVKMWNQCGLSVQNAGDSQALIQLKKEYCDKKECLRCRIGYEYLKSNASKGQQS